MGHNDWSFCQERSYHFSQSCSHFQLGLGRTKSLRIPSGCSPMLRSAATKFGADEDAPDQSPPFAKRWGLRTGPGPERLAIGASPSPSAINFSWTPSAIRDRDHSISVFISPL
jgi:hypothetical protein